MRRKLQATAHGKADLKIKVDRPVNSWAELAEKVEQFEGPGWIFRGVPDKTFDLVPKIARPGTRKSRQDGSDLPYEFDEEDKMFKEFQRIARPYFAHEPKNDLERLAIAQHHGLPTRLLDWTESLLVAAYFALEEAGTRKQPPAIYAIADLPVLRGHEDPFHRNQEIAIYRPPHISPRIPVQRSVFTLHPRPEEPPLAPPRVDMLILPRAPDAIELKERLDDCAINRASLFPDLDGLAQYTAWRHKWGRLN